MQTSYVVAALLVAGAAAALAQSSAPNKKIEQLFLEDQSDPRPVGTPEQAGQTNARARAT